MSKKENNKKSNKKLNKAEYNMTHSKSNEIKPPKTASLILLAIMLISIVGFAFVGTSSDTSSTTSLPFGEYQTTTGSVWAAVINEEQFVFEEIDSLAQNQELEPIATSILNSNLVNVYVEDNFSNLDGAFLLEQKISAAYNIPIVRVQNLSCETTTTVVFTYNATNYDSSCLTIESIPGEEFYDANSLMYFLVKDYQG